MSDDAFRKLMELIPELDRETLIEIRRMLLHSIAMRRGKKDVNRPSDQAYCKSELDRRTTAK